MSVRAYRDIERRKSRQIMVGNVPVGGDAPITVQTMTNTLTTDVKATIEQVQAAADIGTTAYAGTPDYLKAILDKADEMGIALKINQKGGAARSNGDMIAYSLREISSLLRNFN